MQLHYPITKMTLSVSLLLLLLTGCGPKEPETLYDRDSFTQIETSSILATAFDDGWRALKSPDSRFAENQDLMTYFKLTDMVKNPATRDSAMVIMSSTWQADPQNLVFLRLASGRFRRLLPEITADIYADEAVVNPDTPHGQFALAMHAKDKAARISHLEAAVNLGAGLSTFEQAWLQYFLIGNREGRGLPETAITSLVNFLPTARAAHPLLEMLVWRQIGRVLTLQGHTLESVHAHVLAANLAHRFGANFYVCVYQNKIATSLVSLEQSQLALPILLDGIVISECHQFIPYLCAMKTLASSIYTEMNQRQLALELEKEVVSTAIASGDTSLTVRSLVNVATSYQGIAKMDSSLCYLDRAQLWSRGMHNPQALSQLALYRSEFFFHSGDYATVDSLLAHAKALMGNGATANLRAILLKRIIRLGRVSGNPEPAYRAIDELRSLKPIVSDRNADYSLIAGTETAIAEFLGWQGEHALAHAALDSARLAARVHGNTQDEWYVERIAFELAMWSDDLIAARTIAHRCLDIAQSLGRPDLATEGQAFMGRYHLARGACDSALSMFAQVTKEDSDALEFRAVLSSLVYTGVAYSQLQQYDDALASFRQASSLFDSNPPADLKARLLVESGRVARSTNKIKEAETCFVQALSILRETSVRPQTEGLSTFYTDQVREVTEELINLYLSFPKLAGTESAAEKTLMLAEACRMINTVKKKEDFHSTSLTVAYFVGMEQSFQWIITPDGITAHRLPGKENIKRKLAPVLADFKTPGRKVDQVALRELSHLLLNPVYQVWEKGSLMRIVPDDLLQAVPWYGLVFETHGEAPQSLLQYGEIIESTFSGSTTSQDDRAHGNLLAVGVNARKTKTSGMETQLRFAEQEAQEIADEWAPNNAVLALGADASWSKLKLLDLSHFNVIHIATHTTIYQGQMGQSVIRLGLGENATPLSMAEISKLQLNADLVFLSCCEAAKRVTKAGATTNFAQAFLDAGAQSVIAPTISIEDEAARYLASQFYGYWQAGNTKSAALRQALLDISQTKPQWEHPQYWSFYRLIER